VGFLEACKEDVALSKVKKDWRKLVYFVLLAHMRIRREIAEVTDVLPDELARKLAKIELYAIQAKGRYICYF
jgi:hypothetical protein